jgi:hypothetical protein
MQGTTLTDIVRRLAALELAGWQGLPAELRLPPGHEPPASLSLGEAHEGAEMAHLDDPQPGAAARAWLRDGRVVMVDVALRPARDLADAGITEAPDERLDVTYGLEPIPAGEWVYARRGLALIVRPHDGVVLHIIAYVPTPAAAYARGLRPSFEAQRRPPRQALPLDV